MSSMRTPIDPAILAAQLRSQRATRERRIHSSVTPPTILLARRTKAQTLLNMTEEFMHNAENIVDESRLARDDLVAECEKRIWVAVVQ